MPTKSAVAQLDEFDRAILDIVQRDNRLSHAAIGARVHLSASAVRRRLDSLRERGVISAEVAIVDPATLGDTFIVQVTFAKEDPTAVAAFRARMEKEPAVAQCFAVSGEVDYWLVVHADSPAAYHAWGERVLLSDPAIARYSTSVVWARTVDRRVVKPASG